MQVREIQLFFTDGQVLLQRMFLATRLILILKTKETSKGNTCGYMLVLLDQARAHEYHFINIQYKYCTISMQGDANSSPSPCSSHLTALWTLAARAGAPAPPRWSQRSMSCSGSRLISWLLSLRTCNFAAELKLGCEITFICDFRMCEAEGDWGCEQEQDTCSRNHQVRQDKAKRTVIENGYSHLISQQNVQENPTTTWKTESWMHKALHKLPIKNFPGCRKFIFIYLLRCCF